MYIPGSQTSPVMNQTPFHETSWWTTHYDSQNLPYYLAYHTVQYYFPPMMGAQSFPLTAILLDKQAEECRSVAALTKEIDMAPQISDETKPLKLQKIYNESGNSQVSWSAEVRAQPFLAPFRPTAKQHSVKTDLNQNEEEDAESSEFKVDEELNLTGRSSTKRVLWKPQYSRKYTFQLYKGVVNSSLPERSYEETTKIYEDQLMREIQKDLLGTHGELNELIMTAELVFARKNMTSHFAKLIRFAIKLYKESNGKSHRLEKLEKSLGQSIKIATIVNIYREPSFNFFVEFLREKVFILEKMPELIMTLNIRSCQKYVMLAIVPGFVYALHHPWEDFTSWNMQTHTLIGETGEIIKQIREKNIGYEDIMQRLFDLYDKIIQKHPEVRNSSKYNNLSYHYRVRMEKIMRKMIEDPSFQEDWEVIHSYCEAPNRSYSIEGIKELLAIGSVRRNILHNFIETKQLIIDILEDSSLSCHSKKIILQNYPKFTQAVESPASLMNWHA